ncbi:MAG: twin-arginine translocase TatA/TatE family subunit [Planctomycetales bacterium]
MFGVNHWEVLLLLGIIVLLFGGSRIPGIARSLGQSITEFKKGVKGIDEGSNQESQAGSKSES